MPQHYNKKGGFLKDSMMINVHPEAPPQKAKKKPEPMPMDEHIRPPVIDSGIDDGQGSSSSESNGSQSTIDENLILLGLGALILCSVVMMK